MKTAYIHLVNHVIREGGTIVLNGHEFDRSIRAGGICTAIRQLDACRITVLDRRGLWAGWADIKAYDMERVDTVVDYAATPFMDRWYSKYLHDIEDSEYKPPERRKHGT
jgi:hypothetical protein